MRGRPLGVELGVLVVGKILARAGTTGDRRRIGSARLGSAMVKDPRACGDDRDVEWLDPMPEGRS
ncbi:hypothetical protein, partial [Pseudofrankia sp. EUN1h]|uniref:hypothetical protein n=1 Tax=Pseudofrankia sp. EUN1h TaxID=1834515 RepID=UPI001A7E14FA